MGCRELIRELDQCFPRVRAAPFPMHLPSPPEHLSELWTSHSGIYRHCSVCSLFDLTRCFVSVSPPFLPSLPREQWEPSVAPRVQLSPVRRGLNHMAFLCGSERPPLNCDIYCFTFPFFHLNGRIVHLLPPVLCPWFVLF